MLGSIFDQYLDKFAARYRVVLEFPPGTRFIGSSPAAEEAIHRWMIAKLAGRDEEMAIRVSEALKSRGITDLATLTIEQVNDIAEELSLERSGTVHQRDPDGNLIVFHGRIKAMLKEAISVAYPYQAGIRLGMGGAQKKSPQSFLAEVAEIRPERVPIMRRMPDGTAVWLRGEDVQRDTMAGTVSTPQGPRSIISQYEYVEDVFLEFTLLVIGDAIPGDVWPQTWLAGMFCGLGAKRSLGHGRFRVTAFERLNAPTYFQEAVARYGTGKRAKVEDAA